MPSPLSLCIAPLQAWSVERVRAWLEELKSKHYHPLNFEVDDIALPGEKFARLSYIDLILLTEDPYTSQVISWAKVINACDRTLATPTSIKPKAN